MSHSDRVYHGLSKHPVYGVWKAMMQRCYNPKFAASKDYLGRGISVCEEWRNNTKAFINWALANGWSPWLELDRINNDGNYEPSNCRFATHTQNLRNTRSNVYVTFKGETLCQAEWGERFGLDRKTVSHRVKRNIPLDIPSRKKKKDITQLDGNKNAATSRLDGVSLKSSNQTI